MANEKFGVVVPSPTGDRRRHWVGKPPVKHTKQNLGNLLSKVSLKPWPKEDASTILHEMGEKETK